MSSTIKNQYGNRLHVRDGAVNAALHGKGVRR